MTRLLFVTPDRSTFAELSSEIEKQSGTISWAATGRQARETIRETALDLVLTDERLDDMSGLELIKRVTADNPMVNCAVISSLSEAAYHEASEGLGILMQLPPNPVGADGKRLMTHLNQILGLTKAER